MKSLKMVMGLAAWTCALLSSGVARANDIPGGTYTTTITIANNSELEGDITCTATATPCIAIAASHVHLDLNGFSITGQATATPPTNCFGTGGGSSSANGIEVVNRTDVEIEGPGIIQEFQRWGIKSIGSDNLRVKRVTAYRNCWSGIQLISTSDSHFEENLWVNNAVGSGTAACGGMCFVDSNHNEVRKSTLNGNGTVVSTHDFGVGFEGTSSGNVVEENDIGGNVNGVFIVHSTATGNVIRRNAILGNPPAQVGADHPSFSGKDIQDTSLAGANTFKDNLCLTYKGFASPAPCPSVTIKKDDDEARNRLTNPVQTQQGSSVARNVEPRLPILTATASLLALALAGSRWNSIKFVRRR